MHEQVMFQAAFADGDVTAVRHAVHQHASAGGLSGQRLDDFVLAVNELITNAVRHGGGTGRVRVLGREGAVRAEVTDEGPGIPGERLANRRRPSHLAPGGRGLWLARTLCDDLSVQTGPLGTTVCVAISTGGTPVPADPYAAAEDVSTS